MANRYTTQWLRCLQKEVSTVICRVTFGAAGAPTIDRSVFNSEGLVSVTRNGAGVFTFVFGTNSTAPMLDTYNLLLGASVLFDATGNSGTAPAAPLYYLTANNVSTFGTASLQLTFTNTSQTATDPASGEAVDVVFFLKNSNAP